MFVKVMILCASHDLLFKILHSPVFCVFRLVFAIFQFAPLFITAFVFCHTVELFIHFTAIINCHTDFFASKACLYHVEHYMRFTCPLFQQIHKTCVYLYSTPIYKTTILGTEKHIAEIFFFGRFLLRLSGPDYSRVISKASFCWAHSN